MNGGAYRGRSAALAGGATLGGNVGIGTDAPAGRLHVVSTTPVIVFANADPAPSAVTQSGLIVAAGFPASALDDSLDSLAWHTDSSQAGAWLRVDLGAGDARAYQKTRIYSTADSATVGRYDVQYSDDGSAWTTAFNGFVPSSRGWNEASWAPAGSHRYWRLLLANTPGSGPWLTELEWYAGEAAGVRSGPGLVVLEGGDVGIGTDSPTAKLDVVGRIRARSGLSIGDVAEPVAGQGLEAGMVVVMDGFTPDGKLRVRASDEALSREVVGVVSGDPSLVLAGLATDTPMTVTGIVAVKVHGPVARGDLLTTSDVPGHAMACREPARCFGAVVGKSLEGHAGDGPGMLRAILALG